MPPQKAVWKNPIVHAVLIGAVGGMSPKLIELIPELFANKLPSLGVYLGLGLLAFIGAIAVLVSEEKQLRKALILGAGAPALIGSLAATGLASTEGLLLPRNFSLIAEAHAQIVPRDTVVRFILQQNQSPYRSNALWIRADDSTIHNYWTTGDTILIKVPTDTKELRVGLPVQSIDAKVKLKELDSSQTVHIKISDQQQTSDFWKTFGGKQVPNYKVEQTTKRQ